MLKFQSNSYQRNLLLRVKPNPKLLVSKIPPVEMQRISSPTCECDSMNVGNAVAPNVGGKMGHWYKLTVSGELFTQNRWWYFHNPISGVIHPRDLTAAYALLLCPGWLNLTLPTD